MPSPTPSDSEGRTPRSSSARRKRTRRKTAQPSGTARPGKKAPARKRAKAPSRKRRAARAAELPPEVEGRIGHRFSERALLVQALTHRSHSQEVSPPQEDNERLEFLGDAVLQLIVTDRLWRENVNSDEGELTKRRSDRVSGRALARLAREVGLADYLRLGRGEEKTGGRKKASILADAFEALVGAIYLDAGYAACALWVEGWLWREPEEDEDPEAADHKSRLQEAFQSLGQRPPVYRVVRERGPEHRKVFDVEVHQGGRVLGRGRGTTKKAAEQAAARESLAALKRG